MMKKQFLRKDVMKNSFDRLAEENLEVLQQSMRIFWGGNEMFRKNDLRRDLFENSFDRLAEENMKVLQESYKLF